MVIGVVEQVEQSKLNTAEQSDHEAEATSCQRRLRGSDATSSQDAFININSYRLM